MATLSTNDIKIRYDIDLSKLQQASSQFDKLTSEERQLIAELGKLKKQFEDVGDKATKAGKSSGDALGGMGQVASKLGPAIAGIFAADKIIDFGKQVIAVTAEFQKLAAVLKNTLGSESAALGAMTRIQEFASQTPFSVQELTQSFVKLANQGFTPTNAQLRKLGDLASSTGKSFDQLTEAIIDAQTGEFERLKEFGIRASKAGDNVTFTFKGVQTQTKFTNDAIREYITSLGDLQGVSGSMAAISQTLEGQTSNLGDAWDSLLNTIGNSLGPVYSKTLTLTADFLKSLNILFKGEQQQLKEFEGNQYNAYSEFFVKTSDQALKNIASNSEKRIVTVKSETTRLKAEYEKQKLAYALAQSQQMDEKGSGFTIRQRQAMEAAKAEYDQSQKLEKALIAQNQAAIDEIEKRKKASSEASVITEKQLKAEYDARMKLLDLEKQQLVLMAKIRGSKLGELGAERNYAEGVYSLKKEYSAKNIGISKDEVKVAQLTAKERTKAFEDAAKDELLATKQVADITGGIRDKTAKDDQKYFDAKLQKIKDNLDAEVKATKDAEAKKQAIIQASFELAFTLTDGFTNLYTANIDREISALNKRSEEEIRMADGNQQKIDEINQRKAAKERELKIKAFNAERAAAIARVVFETASMIAKWASNPISAPLAALALFNQAAQIGFILAQPTPEFAEGTKGKPFEGGQAIVGERGVEKVVTQSGKVYFTPNKASLVELPKGSQVIPHHQLTREERFLASSMSSGASSANPMIGELRELGSLIKNMPITQVSMDERGFEKFIRTPRRTTKILNNRFRSNS
jgi:hypothetical protein